MKHKKQKRPKPKIVRTCYKCAYVREMTVLIIFPVILQMVINLIMLHWKTETAVLKTSPKTKYPPCPVLKSIVVYWDDDRRPS